MRVGTAGNNRQTQLGKRRGQGLRILDNGPGIAGELRPQCLAERHRLGGDDMHQRAALQSGKNRGIDPPRNLRIVAKDHAAARAAQCLVRRCRDNMRVLDRAGMRPAGDQTGEMCHVDHQIRADAIGDRAEAGKIDGARIGAATGDDQPRPMLFGLPLHFVEIDARVVGAYTIRHGVKPLARQIGRRTVRQMTAGGERHAEDRVAGLEQRQKHRLVRLCAGMRLHIGKAATEQLLGALDRQPLCDIDEFAATVIAAAGIALGVFVGQQRTLHFEHRLRDDVLAGDQLDLRLLALTFAVDRRRDFRIARGQVIAKKAGRTLGEWRDS